jgi:CheY-like chemotaxis protein
MAHRSHPRFISIDTSLPDMHGWTVLSRLKHDPELRHIPVQVLASVDDRTAARARGAFLCREKPVAAAGLQEDIERALAFLSSPRRSLLVVESDPSKQKGLASLLDGDNVDITFANKQDEVETLLRQRRFDCVVLDAVSSDAGTYALLQQAASDPALRDVPFVVYARTDTSGRSRLTDFENDMIVRQAMSLDEVLDETSLHLHRALSTLPESQRRMLGKGIARDPLAGTRILVIDDDVRNIFALSTLLETHGMRVISANSGKDGLRLIDETEDLSLVLLDIMMPEVDGYETLRRIRSGPHFRLPIIALTAKAMTADREKCLEAGASDYIAKPVDTAQLLALLRAWLHR